MSFPWINNEIIVLLRRFEIPAECREPSRAKGEQTSSLIRPLSAVRECDKESSGSVIGYLGNIVDSVYPPPPPLLPGLPTSIVLLLVVVASPYVTKFHPFFAVRADKQEKYSHNSAMSPRSFGAPSHPGGAAEWTYKIVSPVAFVHLISSPLGSQFSVRYPVQPS